MKNLKEKKEFEKPKPEITETRGTVNTNVGNQSRKKRSQEDSETND